jgi:hypothetical protein
MTEAGAVVGGREVSVDELRAIISTKFGFTPARTHVTAALIALSEYKCAPADGMQQGR